MITETIMAASPWLLGIMALIAIAIGWNFIKSGQSTQTKGIAKIIGVVLVVALMFNLGFLAFESGEEPVPGNVGGEATWAVVATSTTNNTTVSGNTILTTYDLAAGLFDTSFGGTDVTGSVTISFACIRTDTSVGDGIATAYVVSVPTVTNTTSGVSHDLCTKDALGVFDADFTVDTVVSAMTTAFPTEADDRSETVSLTIVFNAAAVEALVQYSTVSIQYNIGGVVFTHNIMQMNA